LNKEELYYLLLFNRVSNYSSRKKLELLKKYNSYENIFKNLDEIRNIYGKPLKIGDFTLNNKNLVQKDRVIKGEIDFYEREDIFIIDYLSSQYPEILRQIFDPPIVIFVKGNIDILKNQAILAVVGSRKATNRGLTSAYNIASALSELEITIISGLAKGIDSFAHKGALNGIGSTIAVMATGMDRVYPQANSNLLAEISKKGVVLTEFPLGTPPLRYNFPKRNRIISGLANATVVVEASRKSGALITAQYALEQGRDVLAFPGKAGSEFFSGNNLLIKQGAYLVENSLDILDILGKGNKNTKELVGLNKNSKLVYSNIENDVLIIIGDDITSLEDIIKKLTYPISSLISTLIMLELKGVIKQRAGKYFYRVR